jgi:hypothetical protein
MLSWVGLVKGIRVPAASRLDAKRSAGQASEER